MGDQRDTATEKYSRRDGILPAIRANKGNNKYGMPEQLSGRLRRTQSSELAIASMVELCRAVLVGTQAAYIAVRSLAGAGLVASRARRPNSANREAVRALLPASAYMRLLTGGFVSSPLGSQESRRAITVPGRRDSSRIHS